MDAAKALALFLFTIFVLGALIFPAASEPAERIRVVVTAPALRSLVEAVGGGLVDVKSIIPPGVDPHSYEPSIEDVLGVVLNASLIVMTGPRHFPIEEKIEKLAEEGLVRAAIVNYEDYEEMGLTILRIPETGARNPHGYFYSTSGLRAIAKACAAKLSEIRPEYSKLFKENLERYLERLAAIEGKVRAMGVAGKKIILGGPILQYLAEDLGLEVVDVVIPAHGLEPSSRDLEEAVNLVKGGEASLVMLSDQEAFENPALLKAFRENDIPYVIVPVVELSDEPELLPIVAASLLKSNLREVGGARVSSTSLADALLMPSLIANVILTAFTILLLAKVRRHGGD